MKVGFGECAKRLSQKIPNDIFFVMWHMLCLCNINIREHEAAMTKSEQMKAAIHNACLKAALGMKGDLKKMSCFGSSHKKRAVSVASDRKAA